MKILSVGPMKGKSNTCRLRTEALKTIADSVDIVDTSAGKLSMQYRISYKLFNMGFPVMLPDDCGVNNQIRKYIKNNSYDFIWIDKGLVVNPDTLQNIKDILPKSILVSYSPDNMALRHNQSQNYLKGLPYYDANFTTKSYILNDLKRLGAKNVHFVNQSYESEFHYPREINDDDIEQLGADVGFVGAWEEDRMESILYLTRNGIKVRVFGNEGWKKCKGDNPNLIIENHGLYDDDYAKSFKCFKISLCFLRKMNYDQQTSRTMEIPACGGFMLAERTEEHMSLFEEGKEAEFFSSNEELLKKCRYYLEHEDERFQIAENGLLRCKTSGYSNVDTLRRCISLLSQK